MWQNKISLTCKIIPFCEPSTMTIRIKMTNSITRTITNTILRAAGRIAGGADPRQSLPTATPQSLQSSAKNQTTSRGDVLAEWFGMVRRGRFTIERGLWVD